MMSEEKIQKTENDWLKNMLAIFGLALFLGLSILLLLNTVRTVMDLGLSATHPSLMRIY